MDAGRRLKQTIFLIECSHDRDYPFFIIIAYLMWRWKVSADEPRDVVDKNAMWKRMASDRSWYMEVLSDEHYLPDMNVRLGEQLVVWEKAQYELWEDEERQCPTETHKKYQSQVDDS